MDAPYLLKVQDISKETIEKYPKLEEIFRQVSAKYDKMVTEDCPPREGVYCDPLHYTRSTISLTPDEFDSLRESGVEYQLERYEGGYEFSRVETSIWTADLRTECQNYHDGRVMGLPSEGVESGQKQQQDCVYDLDLIKTESDFLTRLIRGQQ